MIRDAILKTKRDELGNIITSRKRKLAELYHATVSFASADPFLQHHSYDAKALPPYTEAEFLEANNILEAKYFDVATLRRVPGAHRINELDRLSGSRTVYDRGPFTSLSKSFGQYDSSRSVAGRKSGGEQVASTSQQSSRGTQATFDPTEEALEVCGKIKSVPVENVAPVLPTEGKDAASKSTRWSYTPGDNLPLPSNNLEELSSTASRDISRGQDALPANNATGLQELVEGLPKERIEAAPPPVRDTTTQVPNIPSNGINPGLEEKRNSRRNPPTDIVACTNRHSEILDISNDDTFPTNAGSDSKADPFVETSQDLRSQFNHSIFSGAPEKGMGDEGESSKHMGASITIGEQIESAGESRLLGRRMQPTSERRLPGMIRDKSKDLMFSQRPPMRIDTGVSSLKSAHETYEKVRSQASADAQSPPNSITPVKATPTTAHTSPPERMTTRVSSGALRHKSVSEILGETPRTATHHTEKTPVDKGSKDLDQDNFSKHGQLVASPDSMTFRSRLSEMKEREKERSKLSTVIFALQQHHDSAHQSDVLIRNVPDPEKHSDEPNDYLQTLFTAQCSAQQPSLNGLLASAHKTLSTANHYIDFHEQQDCRILKRIYHLQNSNRWSLRQLERSQEPSRPATHWDAVLGHMKWMQTDFREERKWKLVAAKNLADWCAEWVLSSVSRRATMQVRKPRLISKVKVPENQSTPVSLFNGDCSRSETTPELMLPTEDNMSDFTDDSISQLDIVSTPAPAAVFSLAPDDVIFTLERTPLAEKLLDELPLYRPLENLKDLESRTGELDKDCKAPLVPISKFTNGKMVLSTPLPPKKRSRYDYEGLDDPLHNSLSQQFARFDHDNDPLPPELQDVALFNPENKHIIDRLHAAHAFRPPSEFSMPSQSFFESRNCSQWTWNEDDELRRLVKEYAYNWSLISSCLRSPSLHSSGAERRTPWECFERWVSFEGLPGDMGRTQYFRTWYARRDAAKALMNQQMAAQQQQPGSGASQAQVRRRTVEPIRVDRRRNSKHLALFDAMRKVAKKKETALQKQQHVASLAAMRKATESIQPRQRMQTPAEFSSFKHEREVRMQEKQELFRQQMAAQSRAAQAAKQNLPPGHSGVPNMQQQIRNAAPGNTNGTSPHLISSLPHPPVPQGSGQNRPLPSTNGIFPNGAQNSTAPSGVRGGGIPPAPMQTPVHGQTRMPPDMRILAEARALQEQQQFLAAQLQQRQQRYGTGNSVNGPSTSPQGSMINNMAQNNAAMMANLQAANGKLSPSVNGLNTAPRLSLSPQMAHAVQAQQLSNGMTPMVNRIATEIKALHPTASPEQIRHMAADRLHAQVRSANSQAAMQAAAGIGSSQSSIASQIQRQQNMSVLNSMLNPQMYSQYMHTQQPPQQSHNGTNSINGVRPSSRDNTSQMRNGTPVGTSQSPRPVQAQMATMQ